jgi:hypothetical protein
MSGVTRSPPPQLALEVSAIAKNIGRCLLRQTRKTFRGIVTAVVDVANYLGPARLDAAVLAQMYREARASWQLPRRKVHCRLVALVEHEPCRFIRNW